MSMLTYLTENRIVGPLLRQTRHSFFFNYTIKKNKYILCSGIQKCGNTYLWFLLANYFSINQRARTTPLTFAETKRCFPTSWSDKSPSIDFNPSVIDFTQYGFNGFVTTHRPYEPSHDLFYRSIYLYRNPLDFLISLWYYWYVYRANAEQITLGECAHRHISYFAEKYTRNMCNTKALHLSYEELTREPLPSLKRVLMHIAPSHTINDSHAELAVTFSSKDVIKEMEERSGSIHAPKNYKGKFVRSGAIGQWKTDMAPADVDFCLRYLKDNNIPLDSFIFE